MNSGEIEKFLEDNIVVDAHFDLAMDLQDFFIVLFQSFTTCRSMETVCTFCTFFEHEK